MNTEILQQSIHRHLQGMLNTRRGSVTCWPDYGLPDMLQYYAQLPASKQLIVNAVKTVIERYEPRLQDVQIQVLEKPNDYPGVLSLLIETMTVFGYSIAFETVLLSGGKLQVKNI